MAEDRNTWSTEVEGQEEPQFCWWKYFPQKKAIAIGAAQIMLGVISVIFGIQAILSYAALHYSGIGIWAGLLCVASGIVAVFCGVHEPSRTYVMITLLMALAALLASLAQAMMGGIGLYMNYSDHYRYRSCYCSYPYSCTKWYTYVCLHPDGIKHARTAGYGVTFAGFGESFMALTLIMLGWGCSFNKIHPNRNNVEIKDSEKRMSRPVAARSNSQGPQSTRSDSFN